MCVTHITLSQLNAAAPEFSFPLGDKPVSQPALSQTLVGHSVIVVRHVLLFCSLVGNFKSHHLRGLPPGAAADCRLAQPATSETGYIVPLRPGDLPCLALKTVVRLHPTTHLPTPEG